MHTIASFSHQQQNVIFFLEPNPPTFQIIDVGETYVQVSWEPSRSGNPGSVFFIQYRPRGKLDHFYIYNVYFVFYFYYRIKCIWNLVISTVNKNLKSFCGGKNHISIWIIAGRYPWTNSPNEILNYTMGIQHLDAGTTYQLRVVAKNGEFERKILKNLKTNK